jgi:hypothetical protein
LGSALLLDVVDWAALLCTETAERYGVAEEIAAIPTRHRRRLPAFSRDVVRCAMPLLRSAPESTIVFSSPHGDLSSTVTLLTDIARREVLSPTLFSLSVHNAPAGVLSLCFEEHGDHTAVAGGMTTLSAALIEAYVRLVTIEARSILLIYADERLPPIYADLDEDAPGVFLALSLRSVAASASPEVRIGPGRAGAVTVVRALLAGARRLRFFPAHLQALAA